MGRRRFGNTQSFQSSMQTILVISKGEIKDAKKELIKIGVPKSQIHVFKIETGKWAVMGKSRRRR